MEGQKRRRGDRGQMLDSITDPWTRSFVKVWEIVAIVEAHALQFMVSKSQTKLSKFALEEKL